MRMDTFLFTNAGGREYNEDAAGWRALPDGGICVLADGLGGHRFGDLASQCALRSLLEAEPPTPAEDGTEWLNARIESANEAVMALQQEKGTAMKTTVAALLVRGREARWANVGDSRVYRIHNDELTGITEDHSVAYHKYKAGEITRAEICFDEDQSSLLRALGNPERHQPSCYAADPPLSPGDGFLLCSDGAWEYLPDGEILIDFLKSASAREWCELLLVRILSRVQPGNDNLSLITVIVQGGDEENEA